MTTEAYHRTLGSMQLEPVTDDQLRDEILQELHYYEHESQAAEQNLSTNRQSEADQLLGNITLFMRDTFWYLEFASAIPEGDIGWAFEIIKVRGLYAHKKASCVLIHLDSDAAILILGFRGCVLRE